MAAISFFSSPCYAELQQPHLLQVDQRLQVLPPQLYTSMAQFKFAWGSHGALPPLQEFCNKRAERFLFEYECHACLGRKLTHELCTRDISIVSYRASHPVEVVDLPQADIIATAGILVDRMCIGTAFRIHDALAVSLVPGVLRAP